MWISEKYCKNWGLKEGIREFLQNQYDGIIEIIGKDKLNIEPIGNYYELNIEKKLLILS